MPHNRSSEMPRKGTGSEQEAPEGYRPDTDMFLTWEEYLLRRVGLLPADDEPPYDGPMTTVGECARETLEVEP